MTQIDPIMAGIYLHIPFCKQRCIYCDFYSTSLHSLVDDYVTAVIAEAGMRPAVGIRTLYVGGGTPSQLPQSQFRRLVEGLGRHYDLSGLVEFTVEVNPDDVNAEYMDMLSSLGVNRISMGVQSFVDTELALINRRHDAAGAVNAIDAMRAAGINNVSIDLIYGIPGQTLDSWRYSVEKAISLKPDHISAYNLSYEQGTRLWAMRQRGDVAEIDEQTCVEMYNLLTGLMREAGYSHYEISNYCLPGRHSRHNSAYWDGTPYVGLGASAHSYDGRVRSYNPASLKEYIDCIADGHLAGVAEETEWWERYDEVVMVALRTARGLDVEMVKEQFGESVYHHLLSNSKRYLHTGQLVKDGNRIYIPEVSYMMSDAIIRDLMWDC